MKDVTFLLPAYNEERSIGTLITRIQRLYPRSQIVVINNKSTDRTVEIAKTYGVQVIHENNQGKGYAVRKGFNNVESEIVVMFDADNTYNPNDANKLIKCLNEDRADLVLGNRLNGKKEKGSISTLNIIGNHILSFTATLLYSKISDVCTGFWVFKKDVIQYYNDEGLNSTGFELEVEMFIKASEGNFRIKEVPVTYKNRVDSPKLNSLKDGWRIFKTLWINKLNIDY
ncbi:MAG: glycosyltransferase family 2 protein [Methanobacterium sp.]